MLLISTNLIGLFLLIAEMDSFQIVCLKPFTETNALKKTPSFWLVAVYIALKEQFHIKSIREKKNSQTS